MTLAYVDTSVMSYTVQAIAGVAIALGVVFGVVWRKVKMDALDTVNGLVADMLEHPGKFADKIQALMDKSLYNPGRSGEVAGRYVLESLRAIKNRRQAS